MSNSDLSEVAMFIRALRPFLCVLGAGLLSCAQQGGGGGGGGGGGQGAQPSDAQAGKPAVVSGTFAVNSASVASTTTSAGTMNASGGNGGPSSSAVFLATAPEPVEGQFAPIACPEDCPADTPETDGAEVALQDLISEFRSQNGRPTRLEPYTRWAARGRSKDASMNGNTLDTTPHGLSAADCMFLLDGANVTASEIRVSRSGTNAQAIFDEIRSLPVLLDPDLTACGVGVANFATGEAVAVVILCNHP
jgi:hypothetical protein